MFGPILDVAANALIMWYLLRSWVKAAFLAENSGQKEIRRVA